MTDLLTVGPKCTLVATHAASDEYADGTDGWTDGRTQTVTLRFLLNAASVMSI